MLRLDNIMTLSMLVFHPTLTVLQVLEVLSTSPELVTLLQGAEAAYAAYITSRARRLDGQFGELLPWLCEQLAEWEVGATANFLGESPVGQAVPQLTLFGVGEDGVAFKVRDVLTEAEAVCKVVPVRSSVGVDWHHNDNECNRRSLWRLCEGRQRRYFQWHICRQQWLQQRRP